MRTILATCLLFAACDNEKPVPPALPAPVYVCCPTEAPTLLSPQNGEVLTGTTTFRWTRVEGAAKYAITAPCEWQGSSGIQYFSNLIQAQTTDTFITVTPAANLQGASGEWGVVGLGSDNTVGPWPIYHSFTIQ